METESDRQYTGKSIDELLEEIEASWARLMETMSAASEADRTGATDPQGWTVLDHMAHVTAWERSVVYPLQGRRRHEALGITAEEFKQEIDPSNELIRRQTRMQPYETVMASAAEVHDSLIAAIRSSSVEELRKPISELCPGDSASERPFVELLMGDTAEHYGEHREYIEAIITA